MSRKIWSVILAGTMIAGMLAGCGSSTSQSSVEKSASAEETQASAAATEAQETAAAETAAAESQAPAQTEEVSTVEASASDTEETAGSFDPDWKYEPISYPLAGTPVTFDYWIIWELSPDTKYTDISEHISLKELADATGVTLNVLAQSQSAGQTNTDLMIASGDYPDFIGGFSYSTGMDAAIDDDVVVDIKDKIPTLAPDYYKYLIENDGTYWKEIQTDDGHIGAFVQVGAVQEVADGTMTFQFMLDELGYKAEDLKTIDDYAEYLTAAKNQYGMAAPLYLPGDFMLDGDTICNAYGVALKINSMTGDIPWIVEDGEVKSGYLEQGYTDYVTLMHDWYTQGLIDSDTASHPTEYKDEDLIGLVANKEVTVFHRGNGLIDLFKNISGETVVAIPFPTVEEGQQLHVGGAESGISGESGVVITTGCDDVDLAMQFMNYTYTDDWILPSNYGVEGETYDMVDGEPVFQDWTWQTPGRTFSSVLMDYTFLAQVNANVETPGQSEEALACKEIWNANIDAQNDYPTAAAMSVDESTEYNTYAGDLVTIIQQNTAKFITGDRPLSEIEDFQQQLISAGMEECIAQKQAAYDRYMSRD